ncbi:MAG: response regulator [Magnetococcales bacterium]|nr:response regulator [Magnetococcales bacterium]
MEKHNILIVEDIPANIEILVTALSTDYDLTIATNGLDALRSVAHKAPDLILLDVVMPGIDGFEVCAQLKANTATRDIPVIFVTANNSNQDVVRGIELGAYYYLTKPIDVGTMRAVITTALNERAMRSALRQEVRRFSSTLLLLNRGQFELQTMEEAHDLAVLLSSACPNPETRVFGLQELMINAIEHGNLDISYDEKSRLNELGQWQQEVDRRLMLEENRNKWVEIHFERTPAEIRFLIRDQGRGFDWQPFMKLDPQRLFDSHGRGIALAGMVSFDQIEYRGLGNEVLAIIETV